MSSSSQNRIPSLDGLRTISVALVIVSHLLPLVGIYSTGNVGMLGVRFFFVISGFLITGLLLKEVDKTDSIDLTKFYFRRTLRIFPPYYFYLLVIFIATRFEIVPFTNNFAAALTYTSNYFDSPTWNTLHTWSLSVEEQFYLIFPFVLLLFGRRRIGWLLIPLIVAAPILRILDHQAFGATHPMWANYGFHANMDGLATGCVLAVFHARLHASALYSKIVRSRLTLVVPVVIFFVNSTITPVWFYLGISFSVTNILIALMIDWAITNARTSAVGRILNTRPMETIGVMSYSIYLWQQPFLNHDQPMWFNSAPWNLVGIAIFSCFSYFIVEKFSLRWRSSLEKKLFREKTSRETLSPAEITVG